jgi:ABC-type multidrug transport system fused ATPase/permease subunit
MRWRSSEIKNLILAHKAKLGFTYLLYSLEMVGTLVRPFLIGNAVNGLIYESYKGLIILTSVHLVWLVISYYRHRFDTRTYSAIYTDIIKSLLANPTIRSEVSRLSARSTLAKDLVDFMEYDVYFVIEAGYNIFGSLIMLSLYHSSLVWLCLGILFPVSMISVWYSRRMLKLQRSKNDEFEKQVDVLAEGDTTSIHTHFKRLQQWHIRISDQEALNFGVMELLVIGVIFASLLLTVNGESAKVEGGDFIGIYYYLLKFLNGLDTVPYALQRWSTLTDIVTRLEPGDVEIKPLQPQGPPPLENVAA